MVCFTFNTSFISMMDLHQKFEFQWGIHHAFVILYRLCFMTHHIETYQLEADLIWRYHQKKTANYREINKKSEPFLVHKNIICCPFFLKVSFWSLSNVL